MYETDVPAPLSRVTRKTALVLLSAVAALLLTACSTPAPAAVGSVVDLHLTTAGVDEICDEDGCEQVARPDKCFVYVETPDNGFVEAEVWCDSYRDLKVGDDFEDGTHVRDSYCAYKDENGRWRSVGGTNECAEYADRNA